MGLPIRLKELRTFACFPTFQHRGFYFPPSDWGRMVPLSLQRGKYVISFCFPLFKQSGINYPPTSSVPLSFKKGASFLMLSFNQLSHACLLTKWKKCNILSLFLQIHIVESTIHHSLMRMDSRQRIVSNACKSLIS